jgi:hypothetical protein
MFGEVTEEVMMQLVLLATSGDHIVFFSFLGWGETESI